MARRDSSDDEMDNPMLSSLEEQNQDRIRQRAINIALLTIFIDSIMFSIILPSLAIYLMESFVPVDDPWYETWLGVISAAHPTGQLIGSPLARYLFSNWKTQNCMAFFLVWFTGGALMYAVADSAMMLVISRLIQGFGDANLVSCRAYVGHVSKPEEQVKNMPLTSAAQALGFLFGSAIGGLLSFCDFTVFGLPVNSNTAPGFFSFLIGIVNVILCCMYMRTFNETYNKKSGVVDTTHLLPPNSTAILGANLLFFMAVASFTTVLATATIYLNFNFGWETGPIAIVFASGSILGAIVFANMKRLISCLVNCTNLVEHEVEKYLMAMGFAGACLGQCIMGGFGWTTVGVETWLFGCIFFFMMHPYAMGLILSLYSKIIGPLKDNQSFYMMSITVTGSVASIFSPLWATEILGTEDLRGSWTFFFTGIYMLFGTATILTIWGTMVPHPQTEKDMAMKQPLNQGYGTSSSGRSRPGDVPLDTYD